VDDLVIETGDPCPTVCGNLEIEAGEECDGLNDGFCPGACVAPGATGPNGEGECTCVRAGYPYPQPLPNGTTTAYSHGGWWSFTADAPAYAIDTCGSDFDTFLYVLTGTLNSLEIITTNDDCDDNTYGYGENADPLASCYAIGGIAAPYESCTCIATNIGQEYFVYEARNRLGVTTNITLTKRLDCGAVWDNGACCNRVDGTCVDDVAAGDCAGPENAWTLNKLCASDAVTCEPAPGACCHRDPGLGGYCTSGLTHAECMQGYQWSVWTLDATCQDVACTEVRGACCDGFTGNCTNGQFYENCQGQNQVWSKEMACDDVTCNAIPGACCEMHNPDPLAQFGICTNNVLMVDCQGDTQAWYKGATCSQVECLIEVWHIPTVSEWGMVVLALVLVILAKLAFGYRRSARGGAC